MLKIIPTPEFIKQVKKLAKSYKRIAKDLEHLKNELLENPKSGTEYCKATFDLFKNAKR